MCARRKPPSAASGANRPASRAARRYHPYGLRTTFTQSSCLCLKVS
jgi:hypothetical protein